MTSRGEVRANHVIHCTNGWTSCLLPHLAERIFPWRTTMAYHEFDYDPETSPGRVGRPQYIWQEVSRPRHDYIHNSVEMGKHSVTELGPTNQALFKRVLVRSDNLDYQALIDHDDTRTPPGAGHHVSRVLRRVFTPWRFAGVEQPPQIWSGVCGYTADAKPICGQLSKKWTSRTGKGEWICAGCNGMGLATTWALGELLAHRLLGRKEEFIVLPWSYSSDDGRLEMMNVNSFFEEWLPRV
jgi:glycine/D-amino acid oxidase-like deaminating enzyme